MKLSNLPTLFLDGVETGVLLSDFAKQFRRTNSDVPDIYFTLLDAAGIFPTLVLNRQSRRERKLDSFRYMNFRSCKDCTRGVVLPLALCAFD